jgi:hypothetical protein
LPSIATNQQPSDCVGVVHSSLTQQQKNQLPPTQQENQKGIKKNQGFLWGWGGWVFDSIFLYERHTQNYYYIH